MIIVMIGMMMIKVVNICKEKEIIAFIVMIGMMMIKMVNTSLKKRKKS